MGAPVFIISDREVAEELLNVRGRISAGRPPNVLGLELYAASQQTNSLLSHVQDGLGRMEFGIDSARKVTLGGAFPYTESYLSRRR